MIVAIVIFSIIQTIMCSLIKKEFDIRKKIYSIENFSCDFNLGDHMTYNIVDNALYYIKDNNIMDLKEMTNLIFVFIFKIE